MPTPAEEIAWAAGLFEGEGCMTVSGGRPFMRLNSTDEDTPRRFWEVVAAGKVYGPSATPLSEPWGQQLNGEHRVAKGTELFGLEYVPWIT